MSKTISPSETIEEVLRRYRNYLCNYLPVEKSNLTLQEALSEISRLLEEAKPPEMSLQDNTEQWVIAYRTGVNDSAQLYHLNIKRILGIDKPNQHNRCVTQRQSML